ncbi:NAD-dependent DNA ligase LigA [Parasegetibacter sp. NRK P23]|uniref:NAD-dependent DNA ligase LigA n=1 Tax=Parasegetibacter sp. NRK P23 TaxID=2942999 RepID=UPI0020430714|nr:NAD-dependent DNA ligase LigA [Parasegetibacter sp. NRK P23]MCM5527812.1 NAD-dependent DNA ligase LigA [Parasegetibacter sp. NRK P23]
MFTSDIIRSYQEQTLEWLRTPSSFDIQQIAQLRDILKFHEHRYYVEDNPLISDGEYDILYKLLEKTEEDHPELITSDSPTQRVAKGLTSVFTTVQHLVPMLSLENSYNAEDLRDWDRKARELTGLDTVEYCVEPKFDGASISLIYENDLLVRAATRGDGVEGEEITTNVKQIRSVPLSAPFSKFGIQQIEIRGEVLINKNNFAAYNAQLVAQNLAPLANPRNAASGSLRIKDPKEVGRRNLEAFLYHVSDVTLTGEMPAALQSHSASLELLWNMGFRSPVKQMKVFPGIDGVIDYCAGFEAGRDELPYEIDGMVIKVNRNDLQDKMGMTTHHPRWAMAYKFRARQGTSILRRVEFQVGRTGSITPVAKIDPVPIGGVTVGSISLFNEDVVREKDLHIGDTVLVERAGDVIPYIVKPLAELRTGKEEPIIFPTNCPVCGDALFKPEDEAVWRCINLNCEAQVVERMIHFVSKDAMDIRSLGESNIRKFYDLKLLHDIPGIYALDFEAIGKLEGFGPKSITNLQEAIEKSKQQPLHRIIFALGIRYVGETTAKVLARAVEHLLDFRNYSEEKLRELEDVGTKVAGSIHQFFSNQDNLHLLEQLEKAGLNLKNTQKGQVAGGSLSGQTFLFTGTLTRFKRSEAEELVEKNGGKLLSGVSSKLNYLVAGEEAGSKLEKAKKIPTVRVITEDEFLQLFG